MADRLKGKVALVVGAGSIGPGWGNGKATAVAFAREGARVYCADINLAAAEETAGIIKAEGGDAAAHRADVSKAADVAAMVAACAAAYGRIDVLDNNVGIAEVGGFADVGAVRRSVAAFSLDDAGGFLGGGQIDVGAEYARALARERQRRRPSVAPTRPDRAGADDKRHLTLEPESPSRSLHMSGVEFAQLGLENLSVIVLRQRAHEHVVLRTLKSRDAIETTHRARCGRLRRPHRQRRPRPLFRVGSADHRDFAHLRAAPPRPRADEMLEPPEMITSLERSLRVRKPSASNAPTSPVCSQPPRSTDAFGCASSRS